MAYANVTAARDKGVKDGKVISLVMEAVKIFKGSLVCITTATGHATHTPTASCDFAGVAEETVDGTGGAGTEEIRVATTGTFQFTMDAGAAQAAVGDEVFWDYSATGTPNKVHASVQTVGPKVGRIVEYISATEVRVRIDGYAMVVTAAAA